MLQPFIYQVQIVEMPKIVRVVGSSLFKKWSSDLKTKGQLFNQYVLLRTLGLLLLWPHVFSIQAQELGQPFIRYYSPTEYNAGAYMYQSIQDDRGIIYYANSWNVRVYDGVSWDYISTSNQKEAFSLGIDSAGIVYVGGNDDIGYLAPNAQGGMGYISLIDEFKDSQRGFGPIYKTFTSNQGAWFQGKKDILFWDGQQGSAKHFEYRIKGFFQLKEQFFMQLEGYGLQRFYEGNVIPITGGEALKDYTITGLLPLAEDVLHPIVATFEKGLFKYNAAANAYEPYQTEVQEYLKTNRVRCATTISGGNWALGTANGGLVVINELGQLMCVVDENMGLMDNQVNHIYEDKDNILWVSLNNGCAKVEISTPISSWDRNLGLLGHVNTIDRVGEKLVVGTNRGLFYLHNDQKGHSLFRRIEEITAPIYSSIQTSHHTDNPQTLYAMQGRVIVLEGRERYRTKVMENTPEDVFYLIPSTQDENTAYALSSTGFYRLAYTKGRWINMGKVAGVPNKYRFYVAEQDAQGDIWVVTARSGVIRFSLNEAKDSVENIREYTLDDGVPDYNFIGVDKIQNRLILTSEKGVYAFNEEANRFQLAKDFGPQLADYFTGFYFFAEDPHDNLWYIAYQNGDELWRERAWLQADGTYKVDSTTLRRVPVMDGTREGNFVEENGVAWFGGTQGLFRYESTANITFTQKFAAYIRKVTIGEGGREIFGGTHVQTVGDSILIAAEQAASQELNLPYSENSLVFHFSSNNYFEEDKNRYSYRLIGSGESWSPWEEETKEYVRNLREGTYTFEVRSKNIYGAVSQTDRLTFTILPPWQRTNIAYLSYGAVAILLIWMLVKFNTRRLVRQRNLLEQTVRERTSAIEKQKEEIESQANYLKQANEEITVKNEVLAQQQEELLTKSEEIGMQNDLLEKTNKQMRDSINYAGRIQRALLEGEDAIVSYFDDAFVFLKPKDIVSGDFYWFSQTYKNNKPHDVILIAADCTGHGVPGAFMTVMGNALLNEIVNERKIFEPNKILYGLDERVVRATSRQKNGSASVNDGMDICVVKVSPCQRYVRYAGAKNPLYRIDKEGQVEVFKGSKFPIGSSQFRQEKVFDYIDVDARPGDRFYIASDGYQDQFGGEQGRKFLRKRFREFLQEISALPMKVQKEKLIARLEEWQGTTPQTDDILVIGFSIDHFR